MLFRLLIRSEQGCMEDVVDLPRRGETKLVGHMRDLGGYLEGSIPPWGELGRDITWKL